jgi:hypothetical protein
LAKSKEEKTRRVELDIDLRLRYLWEELAEADQKGKIGDLTLVAAFCRWAYGQGYQDGQKEEYQKLEKETGYVG